MKGLIIQIINMRLCLCIAALFFLSHSTLAQHGVRERLKSATGRIFFEENGTNSYSLRSWIYNGDSIKTENPRIVAIVLDITLGVLGMHRLYLGTDLKVPIFYTLTLGGGGVLWIVDLGLLIFSKDIEKFKDNPKLFMWAD